MGTRGNGTWGRCGPCRVPVYTIRVCVPSSVTTTAPLYTPVSPPLHHCTRYCNTSETTVPASVHHRHHCTGHVTPPRPLYRPCDTTETTVPASVTTHRPGLWTTPGLSVLRFRRTQDWWSLRLWRRSSKITTKHLGMT